MALIEVSEQEFNEFTKGKNLKWEDGKPIPYEIWTVAKLNNNVVAAIQQLAFTGDCYFVEQLNRD